MVPPPTIGGGGGGTINRAGTVLDNVGTKCHTINYHMIEDGAVVGATVQLQTDGNNG